MSVPEGHALSVRLTEPLYERLRKFSFDYHISQAAVIRHALETFLESNGNRDIEQPAG